MPDAHGAPRLSIGLPVFNGERYLALALDSLLAQTFRDFELIVSDNASTDRTPDICRDYAAREPRIRYSRLESNVGAVRNHNRVAELARGQYFTWAAHDDLREPEHLARCVAVLDCDPDVVLCYTREERVDAHGRPTPRGDRLVADAAMADPVRRWMNLVRTGVEVEPIYGVVRRSVLLSTGLLEELEEHADRVLLGRLVLGGRFSRVAEPLIQKRLRPDALGSDEQVAARRALLAAGTRPTPTVTYVRRLAATLWEAPLPLPARIAGLRALLPLIRKRQFRLRLELGLTRGQFLEAVSRLRGLNPPRSP